MAASGATTLSTTSWRPRRSWATRPSRPRSELGERLETSGGRPKGGPFFFERDPAMSELDPHFKTHLEAQAAQSAQNPLPPIDQLPPEMVRAGYRMQRQAQDQNAPREVDSRDFNVPGPNGDIP